MRLFLLTRYLRDEESALRSALTETAESVRQLRFVNSALPYSIRLAVAVGVATEIYRRLHYQSGYWIPMTALLVLKPDLVDTASRAIARTLGTMCGAIAISFCLAHMHLTQVGLAAFTMFFAWLAYGVLNVNYRALFDGCYRLHCVLAFIESDTGTACSRAQDLLHCAGWNDCAVYADGGHFVPAAALAQGGRSAPTRCSPASSCHTMTLLHRWAPARARLTQLPSASSFDEPSC